METLKFQENSYLSLYDDGSYDIRLGGTAYVQCFPSVDGKPLRSAQVKITPALSGISVSYRTNDYTLILDFIIKEDYLLLKTCLKDLAKDSIEKISVFQDAHLCGTDKLLSHGYFSWDQSFLYDAAELTATEANALGIVLNSQAAAIAGYLTHDKMFQTFLYRNEKNQFYATSEMYLEGKDLRDIPEIDFSDMVFFSHPDLDKGQRKWADLVDETMQVKPVRRRSIGWCSWYCDYFWFNGEILERHLQRFAPLKKELGLDLFVIDANHFEHLGDWLHPHPGFSKGLEFYARKIKEAGYIPGIWIGPWMVADRSRIFRDHKDWLCRDEKGELIEFMNPLGEDNVWGYRSKIHYCLDSSHPEAFDYLRNVFRTYRKWGFRYFKTDFMFWGSMDRFEGGWYHEGLNKHNLISDKSLRPRIQRHTPGKTRIEYFVDVLKMIREEIGDDSIWLGCGQPIWASIGYVDCMRISRDVGARWVAHNSPRELLNDLALRNFTNRRFYEVDPDCVLLRTWETKINESEATSLALYMGVAQGMIMTSDYVDECPRHRLDLFRFLAGDNEMVGFRPPLLGRETDLIVYSGVRKDNGMGILFFFNNGEVEINKSYTLVQLEVKGNYMVEWRKKRIRKINNTIDISLLPHESRLFYLKEEAFPEGWQPEKITG